MASSATSAPTVTPDPTVVIGNIVPPADSAAATAPATPTEGAQATNPAAPAGGGGATVIIGGGDYSAFLGTDTPVNNTGPLGGPGAAPATNGAPLNVVMVGGDTSIMEQMMGGPTILTDAERAQYGIGNDTGTSTTAGGAGTVGGCGMAGCTMPDCKSAADCGSDHGGTAAAATDSSANGGTAAAAGAAAQAGAVGTFTHTVKSGETVASIAKRYGITAAELKAANKNALQNGKPFKGMKLHIVGAEKNIPASARPVAATATAAAADKPASLDSLAKYPLKGSTKDARIEYIHWAARQYGLNGALLAEVARLESDYVVDAVNKTDSNAQNGTPSKGIMQFIETTFKDFAAKAKKANPDAWKGLGKLNWLDWRQQSLAAAWAIENGKASHWTTYDRAKQKVVVA